MTYHFPYDIIDLTHTLNDKIPTWSGGCGFQHDIKLDYQDREGDVGFRVQQIKMHAGIGTHMDAPAHVVPGGLTIADISLTNLVAPCICIDVSEVTHEKYSVSTSDIKAFEDVHGQIPFGACVMIYTGWDRFWHQENAYRNNHQFPSVSGDAAEFLLERGIVGLGIDTLSPDRPMDGFPVHKTLLGAGKYIIENAANLGALPQVGATLFALPLKTQGGTEAPMRLVALKPKD